MGYFGSKNFGEMGYFSSKNFGEMDFISNFALKII